MKKSITMNFENMDYLKNEVEKLNKKAKKLNCKPIIIENEVTFFTENKDTKEIYKMISFDIEYDLINIENYKILAQLNHTYDENIVNLIDRNFQVDEKYYTIKGYCNHCNINHARKITYLIQDENGKIKQIGKSCLKDYIGYDISGILNMIECINNIEENISDYEKSNIGDRYAKYINTIDFLNIEKMVIEKFGYISNSKAQETDNIPTSFRITNILYGDRKYFSDEYREILDKKYQMSEKNEIFEDVKNALNWLENLKTSEIDNNYIRNLKTISSGEYFNGKEIGYMSSLLTSYYRANNQNIKKEEKKEEKISEYYGNIGEKIQINVTFKHFSSFETMYGISKLYIFEDEKGNIFTWFTTTNLDINYEDKITIKATIKEHTIYEDKKQTQLLRVKII